MEFPQLNRLSLVCCRVQNSPREISNINEQPLAVLSFFPVFETILQIFLFC